MPAFYYIIQQSTEKIVAAPFHLGVAIRLQPIREKAKNAQPNLGMS